MNGEIYGLIAEFDTPEAVVDAVRRARQSGYEKLEAYSPYPIDEMEEVLPPEGIRIPHLMFGAAVLGGLAGWGLQYYCSVIAYPMNIGGRPLNSWPVFLPVIFEMTVLTSALVGVVAMIALNGLPRLNHPLFNVPAFDAASRDKFFLTIEADDPQFDRDATRRFLDELAPGRVTEVPQ
jgi:hypothetical protein